MELGGDFNLNASGILAALQKVDSAILAVSRRATGVATAFGATFAGIALFKHTSERALEAAAGIETLRTEFQTLLGSAKAADSLLAGLTRFADATPFETGDLAANAKTLLAFGATAESILPTLQMIGDVAGADKERFNSLTLAFAQMSATGRLMGQDLLQMVNAGFNPLQEISRTTGRSLAELKKDMEGGAISAEMVADAFKSATSEGGRFFGNLADQSETFKGKMSTLRGAIEKDWQNIGAPILEALKPAIDAAISSATKFAPGGG